MTFCIKVDMFECSRAICVISLVTDLQPGDTMMQHVDLYKYQKRVFVLSSY